MLIYLLIQSDHKLLHSTVSFLLQVRKAISSMGSGGGEKFERDVKGANILDLS